MTIELTLLVVFVVVVGFCLAVAERLFPKARRRKWRETAKFRREGRPDIRDVSAAKAADEGKRDASDQLRVVMSSRFKARALLNAGETRLFRQLEEMVVERNANWRVMAQVSLGEVLTSQDPGAYSCVNAKRVDLLLIDQDCRPRHAVEYQGSGHHQGSAAARDAVKKEALRRAGVGYHEVVAGQTTPAELRRLVEKLVEAPTATA